MRTSHRCTSSLSCVLLLHYTQDLEDATRHLALEFLLTIAENSTAAAKKLPNFCGQIVPIAFSMMLELECDTAEEMQEWENAQGEEEVS